MSRNELTEFHRRTAAHIEREGRSIVGVFPVEGEEGDGLAFSYTIGNHLKGLPELLVIGTAQGFFLNTLSHLMIAAGHGFKDGETVRTSGGKEVKLIRANAFAREEYTIQAGEHFGHDEYEVMQVLIPDKEGRFPGDEGCEKPYASVPVLRVQ
jgi:hypothetical protein